MSMIIDISESLVKPHVTAIADLARARGLDFIPTQFEIVDSDDMSALAAYAGFPRRYCHYTFGQDYEQQAARYDWGRGKIYEMVINNDPAIAYLQRNNDMADTKLVIGHVYGHVDFFTNNVFFKGIRKDAADLMASNAVRIKDIANKVGAHAVEQWLDMCLSIEDLIDPYAVYKSSFDKPLSIKDPSQRLIDPKELEFNPHKFKAPHPDMDYYINGPEYIRAQQDMFKKSVEQSLKFPPKPERDILAFLICHGRMTDWQREILSMIREESYYFVPQYMTKIMNEGWAAYWHNALMAEYLDGDEVIPFAEATSGVEAWPPSGQINPYAFGIKLFRHIKKRWDKGQFGPDWDACTDYEERKNWDKKLGLGLEKIFEVRALYNDVTIIQEFVDLDFCTENKLFVYEQNPETGEVKYNTDKLGEVKNVLIDSLTFRGAPIVHITEGNNSNNGTLVIEQDIKLNAGRVDRDTGMAVNNALCRIWGRPTVLRTSKWSHAADPTKLTDADLSTIRRAFSS